MAAQTSQVEECCHSDAGPCQHLTELLRPLVHNHVRPRGGTRQTEMLRRMSHSVIVIFSLNADRQAPEHFFRRLCASSSMKRPGKLLATSTPENVKANFGSTMVARRKNHPLTFRSDTGLFDKKPRILPVQIEAIGKVHRKICRRNARD